MARADRRSHSDTMRRTAWLGPWTLSVAAVSGFHLVEHVVQAYQKYGMEHQRAHGLLGAHFDNDPMHFAFNWALFLAIVPVLRAGPLAASRWPWGLFVAGFAAQAYHVVEHTVKFSQWAAGADPALGILGHWFPLVPLHLALNTLVYVLIAPQLLACALRWRAEGRRDAAALRAP